MKILVKMLQKNPTREKNFIVDDVHQVIITEIDKED